MSQTQKFDASIPMLTEVLWDADVEAPAARIGPGADQFAAPAAKPALPPAAAAAGGKAAPGAGAAREATSRYSSTPETAPLYGSLPAGVPNYRMHLSAQPANLAPQSSPASAHGTEQQWSAIEQRLSTRILQQVQGSLDDIVAQCVTDVLQGALLHLTGELHRGLHDSVEQIVAQAIGAEIAQLRDRRE